MSSATLIVCLTGAECSGKTTLAEALAQSYGVPLVEEAARSYLADRPRYDRTDVLAIAEEQMRLECAALAGKPPLLICDTDLLVIRVWWEVKYGALPDTLRQALAEQKPRTYLLTRPDMPWVPDPLRESGGDRQGLHGRYQHLLAAAGHTHAEVRGDCQTRLATAKRKIDHWLKNHSDMRFRPKGGRVNR